MFKVYYTVDNKPHAEVFDDLSMALSASQFHRSLGHTFVTMCSENPNCTSKLGVDEVKDVDNYDGWISRGRAP